jgi:hypothetical protein
MPLAARRLLYPGRYRETVLAALASSDLPANADLRTAPQATWDAAAALYEALMASLGRNPWVTASKLCARKRPSFFPVRDSVVTERLLGFGKNHLIDWVVYQHLLIDRQVSGRLARVTQAADNLLGHPITDPPLRVLDVVLWATAPSTIRQKRW